MSETPQTPPERTLVVEPEVRVVVIEPDPPVRV